MSEAIEHGLDRVSYPIASVRRQNRNFVHFPSGVTYYRPNGGKPGQIYVEGAGYLSVGMAEALISALAGACVQARKDQEIGSMGEDAAVQEQEEKSE